MLTTLTTLFIGVVVGFILAMVLLWPASAIALLVVYSWVSRIFTGRKGF